MSGALRNAVGAAIGWVVLAGASRGGETLRGTVARPDGMPAAGAIVWASPLTVSGPLLVRETRADGQGRFAIAAGPGRWAVWARLGTLGADIDWTRVPDVQPGRDSEEIQLSLTPQGTLRGRLLEAETGRPLAGARFVIDNGRVLTTDDEGRFTVEALTLGEHESYVVAPGRVRRRVLFDTTLRPEAELELALPRGGAITGRVTDADGRPIPGAYVGIHTSGTIISGRALFEPCDADGRFVWHGKEYDRPTRLTAGAPGYQEQERSGLIVADDGKPLELDFALKPDPDKAPAQAAARPDSDAVPRRLVTGIVTGPDGAPIAGALVRWGIHQFDGLPETTTDAEGRFRLARVPTGEGMFTVVATRSGLAPAFVPVAAGAEAADVAVKLHPGQSVRGRVASQSTEKPIADVMVIPVIASPNPNLCNPLWLREHQTRTDAEGTFEISGLPASGAKFDFLKPGLTTLRSQELTLGGAANTVAMQAGGALVGRVVDAEGHPVRNFRILVNVPRQRGQDEPVGGFFAGYCGIGLSYTRDDGTFVLTGVQAGHIHRVSALAEGHAQADVDRVVAQPLDALPPFESLTLTLGPPRTLAVVVRDDQDQPLPGARVTLVNGDPGLDKSFSWGYHDASWEDMVRARSDAEGVARFDGLAFGEATVLIQAPGFARKRMGWRDGREEVNAALAPEAVVAGQIRDADGRPVTEAVVNLMGDNGDQLGTELDVGSAGRFRFDQLASGNYTLIVRQPYGDTLHQAKIALTPGKVVEPQIEIRRPAAAPPGN
jgi:hypothetical protein